MAEGIRIQPRPELGFPDGAMVVVVDHARPFPPVPGHRIEDTQPMCSICGVQHFAKNYHIQLHGGAAIVSTGVWDALRGLADNPFTVANPVAEPPTQRLVLPAAVISAAPGSF